MVSRSARWLNLATSVAILIGILSLMPSGSPALEVEGFHVQSVQDVRVNPYFRSDGTYVQGHHRSAPDGNPYNNYSYPGNSNPYTGKVAPGNSDSYLQNYGNGGYGYGNGSGNYKRR